MEVEEERDKIANIAADLARFLGERSKNKLAFTWKCGDLAVVVNDDTDFVIIFYQHNPVYSSLIKEFIIFEPGQWTKIVENLHERLQDAETAAEVRQVGNGYDIGPLVEVSV